MPNSTGHTRWLRYEHSESIFMCEECAEVHALPLDGGDDWSVMDHMAGMEKCLICEAQNLTNVSIEAVRRLSPAEVESTKRDEFAAEIVGETVDGGVLNSRGVTHTTLIRTVEGKAVKYAITARARAVARTLLTSMGPEEQWRMYFMYGLLLSKTRTPHIACPRCDRRVDELNGFDWVNEDERKPHCVTCEVEENLNSRVAEAVAALDTSEVVELETDRSFGIELECGVPSFLSRDRVASILKDNGLSTNIGSYSSFSPTKWTVKTDSSVHVGGHTNIEVCSPILYGTAGMVQVQRFLAIMTAIGTRVNQTCGLHVHHGAEGFKDHHVVKLAKLYQMGQDIVAKILPEWREGNGYCRLINKNVNFDEMTTAREVLQHTGRGVLNLGNMNLLNHGGGAKNTVEFRQGAATLDYGLTEAWIVFTQSLMLKALKARKSKKPVQKEVTKDQVLKYLERAGVSNPVLMNRLADKLDTRNVVAGMTAEGR